MVLSDLGTELKCAVSHRIRDYEAVVGTESFNIENKSIVSASSSIITTLRGLGLTWFLRNVTGHANFEVCTQMKLHSV